jgi:hypothetical protein
MIGFLISLQCRTNNCLVRLAFLGLAFTFLLVAPLWQRCEAQQIPRRIDTTPYQNRGPTPPKLDLPGNLAIQGGISPTTGKRVKVYKLAPVLRPSVPGSPAGRGRVQTDPFVLR